MPREILQPYSYEDENFPENPALPEGAREVRWQDSFGYGVASGIVEPIGAALTIALAAFVVPILPYLLAFAAGAMMYVVVEELIPEMSEGKHSNRGTIAFSLGFVLMMILDVTLG